MAELKGGTTVAGYLVSHAGNLESQLNSVGKIGDKSTLTTTNKNTIVEAINEINSSKLASNANAVSASKLATARTISLTGDVTGSVSFDGSANTSITTTVADDSHNHVISNVDGLQTALDGKASTAIATTGANGLMSSTDKSKLDGIATNANNYSHPTGDGNLHVPATGTTNNGKVLKAGSIAGSLSWGTLSASDVGALASNANAVSASKLETARTISLTGTVTGSTTFDGSGNVSITTTVTDGTTSAKGIVQLSSATNSTSTTLAATASAVKTTYDLANNHIINTNIHKQGYNISQGGTYSNAEGYGAMSNGNYSHAEGYETETYGSYSHAEGYRAIANGDGSHAEGINTKTNNSIWGGVMSFTSPVTAGSVSESSNYSSQGSHAEGYHTLADRASHAEGIGTAATGLASHSEGYSTKASGSYSHAEGYSTTANANYSHAEGRSTTASGPYSHAEGYYTTADGDSSHAEGELTIASGPYSHAEGEDTEASGSSSHAEGFETLASGNGSHAEGRFTTSSNEGSHAEGVSTTASGDSSHAEGRGTKASGSYSHAGGMYTTASVYASTSIGRFNKVMTGSPTTMVSTDDAFVIGSGTSSTALGNAFRIRFNGNTYGIGSFNSSGADYAEYFEWKDGNPEDEDRVGYFVTLEGEKIRKTTSNDDYILGIISVNPSVVGDSYQDDWQGKYVTDSWERIQYEWVDVPAVTKIEKVLVENAKLDEEGNEISPAIYEDKIIEVEPARQDYIPILNSEWNNNEEYIPREQRKEWDAVGMMGKLLVRDDGTCQVNGYCKSNDDGIATSSETGYRVMERISDNIIKVLVK